MLISAAGAAAQDVSDASHMPSHSLHEALGKLAGLAQGSLITVVLMYSMHR